MKRHTRADHEKLAAEIRNLANLGNTELKA